MLNEYIKDLMNDMETDIENFNDAFEENQFNQFLAMCDPKIEEVKDWVFKKYWDRVYCSICNKEISIINCSFANGMTPICKNGCK